MYVCERVCACTYGKQTDTQIKPKRGAQCTLRYLSARDPRKALSPRVNKTREKTARSPARNPVVNSVSRKPYHQQRNRPFVFPDRSYHHRRSGEEQPLFTFPTITVKLTIKP